MKLHLAPAPQHIDQHGGTRALASDRAIVLHGSATHNEVVAARTLQRALERYAGVRWEIRAAPGLAEREGVVAVIDPKAVRQREGYHLRIGDERIGVVAHDGAGLAHAFATLTQIVRQCGRRVPLLHVEDWPEFAHRGVMLDISRDKVPTMETLYGLIDMLAEWKYNQFQLYMEHAFAYDQHRAVWKDASPITGEEALALDAYCRERHIELVPNQNSFGHMERWLKHKPYGALAESPRGVSMPWGRLPASTLDPTDPRSLELIDGLYAELLPHFASAQFNVGCDETWDLGRGKHAGVAEAERTKSLYLPFLLKIHELCEKYGRRVMFWGDIILQHPELIGELPKDVIALDWGYEHDHPFAEQTKAFRKAGLAYYVCPGAGGWNSLIGRTDNALANIRNAAENGRKRGAAGMLVTEWGDNGHMQPLPVAWAGMLYGASMAWSPSVSAEMDVTRALSLHAFDDPSGAAGRAAVDLGNAYAVNGAKTRNGSLLAQLYFLPVDNAWPMQRVKTGGFDKTRERIKDGFARLKAAPMRRDDARLVVEEYRGAAALADAGAMIGAAKYVRHAGGSETKVRAGFERAAKRIEAQVPEQERLWLARNRAGGMRDSTRRLRETVQALRRG